MPRICLFFSLLLLCASSAISQSTTTTLVASPTTVTIGSPVSLTATVAATSSGIPAGTVTFLDGSTTIGSATLSGGSTSPQLVTLASAGVTANLSSATNGGTLLSVDVNGDGRPDLLFSDGGYSTGGRGTYFQVFLNNGNGTYTALASQTYSLINPAFMDVNGDGKIDIVCLTTDMTGVEVLEGTASNVFAAPVRLAGVAPQVYSQIPNSTFTSMAIDDLSGNGKPAILLGEGMYTSTFPYYFAVISIYRNNGDGTFTYTGNQQTEGYQYGNSSIGFMPVIEAMTIADLNGDGKPDVIATTSLQGFPSAYFLLSNGIGSLLPYSAVLPPSIPVGPDQVYSFAVGDFRHVGKIDIAMTIGNFDAASDASTDLSIFPGNGDGTYGSPTIMGTTVTASAAINSYAPLIATVDLNGDGIPDLVDSYGYGYLSNGNGTFTPTPNLIGVSSLTSSNVCTPFCYGQVLPLSFGDYSGTSLYFSRAAGVLEIGASGGGGIFPSATIQPTLAIGTHSLTASYAGGGSFSGSTSGAVTVTVNPIPTTLSVNASPNPVAVNNNFTVTATVLPSSGGTATGSVAFSVGSSVQATATLSGNKATYTSSLGIVGSQTITATYSGDSTFGTSTGSVTVTSLPGYTLTPGGSGTTLSARHGGTAQSTISLTGENGFSGSVAFSCSGLPTGATCSFSPASVTISGTTPAQSALTITVASTMAGLKPRVPLPSRNEVFLAGLLLSFASAGPRRKRRSTVLLATVTLAALAGCGGSSFAPANNTPAPQTVNFNVVATSGSFQASAAYTLNVQ